MDFHLAGVAQLVELQPSKLDVASSNLVSRSNKSARWISGIRVSRPIEIWYRKNRNRYCAHVAQTVERFLGKEEVHRFDSDRGLQLLFGCYAFLKALAYPMAP